MVCNLTLTALFVNIIYTLYTKAQYHLLILFCWLKWGFHVRSGISSPPILYSNENLFIQKSFSHCNLCIFIHVYIFYGVSSWKFMVHLNIFHLYVLKYFLFFNNNIVECITYFKYVIVSLNQNNERSSLTWFYFLKNFLGEDCRKYLLKLMKNYPFNFILKKKYYLLIKRSSKIKPRKNINKN